MTSNVKPAHIHQVWQISNLESEFYGKLGEADELLPLNSISGTTTNPSKQLFFHSPLCLTVCLHICSRISLGKLCLVNVSTRNGTDKSLSTGLDCKQNCSSALASPNISFGPLWNVQEVGFLRSTVAHQVKSGFAF